MANLGPIPRRGRVRPIQPPEGMREQVEEAWAADEELERWNQKVEEAEKEVAKAEREVGKKREVVKNKQNVVRQKRIEARVLRAKRNTHKNKVYRQVEKDIILGIRKSIGIKQTWSDPLMKRALQRGDVKKKVTKGADVSDL